jgi:outer membrane cobalamin receptor
MIESVTVTAEKRDANIREIEMSAEKLDIKTIEKIPTFMGEADVIKVIQLQPGVSVVGEGTSGFYVRGGAVDQNLILLDESTVYNPAHFGGFFSVFNPDAVKSIKLLQRRYSGQVLEADKLRY